jgi:pyruvate,water dikinase
MLAGAEDVESADIVAGAERIQARVRRHPDHRARFVDCEAADALDWISSDASGEAGHEFAAYLDRHGHRTIKELELRQPEWRADPIPLIKSLQIPLRHRSVETPATSSEPVPRAAARQSRGPIIGAITRMARQAVRSREETKSGLVLVTTRFKEAYRRLAELMVGEGMLPDSDAVYFLTHAELGRLVDGRGDDLAARAAARREVFAVQDGYEFPDVFQGEPDPLEPPAELPIGVGAVQGAPVSRGSVVGIARIVHKLEDAEALREGEILIAPITDVGWTPYFSMISGLVTDVGSAVSHGAVVAREYGLPAVVNTRIATRVFETGDRVVLDGERGIVRLATDED